MSDATWYPVSRADEFAVGDLRGARIAGQRLCIGRTEQTLFAIEDTCPHAGGSLSEGMIDGHQVICPLHAYGFDVVSGHCPEDPGCSVQSFAVSEEGGMLQVRLERREATSQPSETDSRE